ncbi:hypothetical protein CN383_00135 [Priestia megaterium]|uniref:hypothetical protein n=1 Tax=Priestia megaterium TaxID=1404 RepID=UPI000BF67D04|nr:hypothetical protein [Priestia megaterium]PFB07262.1 hypothetical protein CN383_00135 [Priestia megaterium]
MNYEKVEVYVRNAVINYRVPGSIIVLKRSIAELLEGAGYVEILTEDDIMYGMRLPSQESGSLHYFEALN